MKFQHEGTFYVLDFPRRDVPVTVKHVADKLKPDQPLPTRRETTARLSRLVMGAGIADEKLVPVEVMRATVRRYHRDSPWSNEQARVAALNHLLPFIEESLRNPVRAAYYSRPRGKKAVARRDAQH
jgi:hypothetical protein